MAVAVYVAGFAWMWLRLVTTDASERSRVNESNTFSLYLFCLGYRLRLVSRIKALRSCVVVTPLVRDEDRELHRSYKRVSENTA